MSTTAAPKAAPPRLIFDDGSRVMMMHQDSSSVVADTDASQQQQRTIRGDDESVADYYEIDRLVEEIRAIIIPSSRADEKEMGTATTTTTTRSAWTYRVALQFPDELLVDAAEVCWEFERRLGHDNALVFVLGDTTYAACCPDTIAAAHLQANVLVHYGHACLSDCSSNSIPVLYSFGKTAMSVEQCVCDVLQQVKRSGVRRLLLLYQVQYHDYIEELQTGISERGDVLVVAGQLPCHHQSDALLPSKTQLSCCGDAQKQHECCSPATFETNESLCFSPAGNAKKKHENTSLTTTSNGNTETARNDEDEYESNDSIVQQVMVGGLEFPPEVLNGSWSSAEYTVLFIGKDTSRQYLNIVLRFLSSTNRPKDFWTWTPEKRLSADDGDSLSPAFQRILNRRFYLVEKAKQCHVFGILVAHLTENTRKLVASLRQVIENNSDDRTAYTFVVGKINPAKLANFPEIDCFVLTACPEHSLLSNERELYATPIITPTELLMALNVISWGSKAYSTHPNDYWSIITSMMQSTTTAEDNDGDNDDSDAPYFSMVTGTYASASKKQDNDVDDVDLAALPGKGALTTFSSAAADFLSQREYQGLQMVGKDDDMDKPRAAVPGQTGIASNYSNR